MSTLNIPVVKGGGQTVPVDTDTIDVKYYEAALATGLKTLVNGGATKIVKPTDETDAEAMAAFHKAAIAKAEERVQAMVEGKLKLGRAAAVKGPSGAVMTEARRIARQLVKDAMRAAGQRVSHYTASEITAAANDLLDDAEQGPGLLKMAEDNITNRTATVIKFDTRALKEDPALVAKAEEAKLKKKAGQLSKTQAGKVAPRLSKAVH